MQQPTLIPAAINDDTPCTGHCTTVLGDDICRSCLRTFDEITRWVEMGVEERRQVNLRIALLTQPLTHPNPPLSGREPSRSSPEKGRLGGV